MRTIAKNPHRITLMLLRFKKLSPLNMVLNLILILILILTMLPRPPAKQMTGSIGPHLTFPPPSPHPQQVPNSPLVLLARTPINLRQGPDLRPTQDLLLLVSLALLLLGRTQHYLHLKDKKLLQYLLMLLRGTHPWYRSENSSTPQFYLPALFHLAPSLTLFLRPLNSLPE